MSEIKVIIKPSWITWNDIHNCLWAAHESNRQKGIYMKTSYLSGDELLERIEAKSRGNYDVFVALDGMQVVGTAAICYVKNDNWYANKLAWGGYLLYGAVIPEYKGKGVFSQLNRTREYAAIEHGCGYLYFDTAENNRIRREMARKNGFLEVRMFASGSRHYSVIMIKYLTLNRIPRIYCKIRYLLSLLKTKIKYKPGHKKRF